MCILCIKGGTTLRDARNTHITNTPDTYFLQHDGLHNRAPPRAQSCFGARPRLNSTTRTHFHRARSDNFGNGLSLRATRWPRLHFRIGHFEAAEGAPSPPRSTPLKDRSSFDEKLAPQHLYHGTEQATTVLREGSRPRVLATTQPRRNRRQQNLKMGEGRRTRRRAPALCGGGGAATPWPVGISGGHARDPSRRRFRPVCPYGAGRGLPRPADALSTWPMGDAAPLGVGGHALCAGSATGGSPMPSSGRR